MASMSAARRAASGTLLPSTPSRLVMSDSVTCFYEFSLQDGPRAARLPGRRRGGPVPPPAVAGRGRGAGVAGGLGARRAGLRPAPRAPLPIPAACPLSPSRPPGPPPAGHQSALHRQMAEGFAVIVTRRPLLR